MCSLDVISLSAVDPKQLADLMSEEESSWLDELGWDFGPVRRILTGFIQQNLLPGYVAQRAGRAVGYAYFLMHKQKGIVGSLFASADYNPQEVAEEILGLVIEGLKAGENIRRIEAQIMPFHHVNLTAAFTRHGFRIYPRYFLELDLDLGSWRRNSNPNSRIIPWTGSLLPLLGEVLQSSYMNEIDAVLCDDYRSLEGCENYLRSLMDNPGCGTYMPDASFIGLDEHGKPGGFVLASRIRLGGGMIPQIAISPVQQGHGMGNDLMQQALSAFRSLGLRTVSLTVTKKNYRAFEWYQRLGFRIRKEFGAYLWERD